MTIKMTVQYDRSHDDKMTSESLTLWLMTITALSRWQDDNQFTMVDYNVECNGIMSSVTNRYLFWLMTMTL